MFLNLAAFGALFVTGLLGSLGHCLGMCGPLVLMVGAPNRPLGWKISTYHYLAYHSSRILVYAFLGALVGALGSLIGLNSRIGQYAAIISLILGVGIIFVGTAYLGWLPLFQLQTTETWLSRRMRGVMKHTGYRRSVELGSLNGLLPCGLVYSALLVAASTGSPVYGALGMLVFGASTIPALLVLGLGANMLNPGIRGALNRFAGYAVLLVGIQLILRGTAAAGWIPHLKAGGIMVW